MTASDDARQPRLYTELAPWFHLLTAPQDYREEAAEIAAVLLGASDGRLRTLLELGSGGGNNASHLKARFTCTLVDRSAAMLDASRTINPELEHVVGDMRSVRLGRTFDAVLVHDAVSHLTTEPDVQAALATVAAHLRPGGVALIAPDFVRESFSPREGRGGHAVDGRRLAYIERFVDPDPADSTYECRFEIELHEDGSVRRVGDLHVCGLFDRATWLRLAGRAGLADARWTHAPACESPSGGGDVLMVRRDAAAR